LRAHNDEREVVTDRTAPYLRLGATRRAHARPGDGAQLGAITFQDWLDRFRAAAYARERHSKAAGDRALLDDQRFLRAVLSVYAACRVTAPVSFGGEGAVPCGVASYARRRDESQNEAGRPR
jgi:hypothetical protein